MRTIKTYLTAMITIIGITLVANIPFKKASENFYSNKNLLMEDCSYMQNNYDESEIDDIPFDTEEMVRNQYDVEDCSNLMTINDESIDDIPFSTTKVIINNAISEDCSSMFFNHSEEIDDIPFNTERVLVENMYSREGWKLGFVLEEEKEIDDIPFNTKRMYKKFMRQQNRG